MNPRDAFVLDERLGIRVPAFDREWTAYTHGEQSALIEEWERIKARIPDRIKVLEDEIYVLQLDAAQEEDWDRVCALYEELYRIASIINDLNIWNNLEPHTSSHEASIEPGIADEHTTREK